MLTEARIVAGFCLVVAGLTTWTHYGWTAALVGLTWAGVISTSVRIQILAAARDTNEPKDGAR